MKFGLMALGGLVLLAAGLYILFFPSSVSQGENRALSRLVAKRLPYPVVFTSRDNLAALNPEPADHLLWTFPGQGEFQAQGRLRMLTPQGKILELTWQRDLPNGGQLIDALSPSVSPDGKRILFAGRRASPSHGRFRVYQFFLDDFSLLQRTGLEDDPGCVRLPPMRHDSQDQLLPEALRKKTDYDDLDPIELADGSLAFSSSREPDLGVGHTRRSLQIWKWEKGAPAPKPMTANRNADRWPWQLASHFIAFSSWSRNREVISKDEKDLVRWNPGAPGASNPTDQWMAMLLHPKGEQFGLLAKATFSIWRPRALEDGRLIFMSPTPGSGNQFRVGVCPPGWVGASPSASPAASPAAISPSPALFFPQVDAQGNSLNLAFPSPFPGNQALVAFSKGNDFRSYALGISPVNEIATAGVELVFDDPDLAEGEPVAVLPRVIRPAGEVRPGTPPPKGKESQAPVLASGLTYSAMGDLPGQKSDRGDGPLFPPPPAGLLSEIRVYASPRDRFDHPKTERVPGEFHFLTRFMVENGSASGWAPSGEPTVLAGFTSEGKVARWTSAASDSKGVKNQIFGFAGDHYSLTLPGKRTFCVGCHPGHSGLAPNDHQHQEKWK